MTDARILTTNLHGTMPIEHGDVSWKVVLLVPRYRTVPSYFLNKQYGFRSEFLKYFFLGTRDST